MALGRRYPSVTPLGNGEMLITEGRSGHPRRFGPTAGRPANAGSAALKPSAVSVARCGARRARFLPGSEPNDAKASIRGGSGRLVRLYGASRHHRPQPTEAMRSTTSARPWWQAGASSTKTARVIDVNGAGPLSSTTTADNGVWAPPAQPHRARRRHCSRHRRQLIGRLRSWISTTASTRSELWNPATGQWKHARGRCRSPASTTRPLSCCPTDGCCPSGGGLCGRLR